MLPIRFICVYGKMLILIKDVSNVMSHDVDQSLRDLAFVNSHHVKMLFFPEAWGSVEDRQLDWIEIDFPPVPRNVVPTKSGVYAFVVEPDMFNLFPANGLFYIGKATSLYSRITSYIGELKKGLTESQRPYIWSMLNRWSGHIKYYYTTTNDVNEAEALEEDMLKAFRPPYNKQYDAETSKVMRAF